MKKIHIIIFSIIGFILLVFIGTFIYFKVTYLSKSEIQDIVIKDIGVSKDKLHFTSTDLDIEDNLYEVEFYYVNHNVEYEYKINAKTGQIIYNNFNSSKTNENIDNSNHLNNNSDKGSSSEITIDNAKKIALDNAQLNENDVTFTEEKTDYDHGKKIYDIEFFYNNQEYNYEVDAQTGEIISYDKDNMR